MVKISKKTKKLKTVSKQTLIFILTKVNEKTKSLPFTVAKKQVMANKVPRMGIQKAH